GRPTAVRPPVSCRATAGRCAATVSGDGRAFRRCVRFAKPDPARDATADGTTAPAAARRAAAITVTGAANDPTHPMRYYLSEPPGYDAGRRRPYPVLVCVDG